MRSAIYRDAWSGFWAREFPKSENPAKRGHHMRPARRPLLRLLKLAAIVTVVAAVLAKGAILWALYDLPLEKQLANFSGSSLLLEAADGRPLGRIGSFSEDVVQPGDFPEKLVTAVLSIEDRRFYDHWGVDPWGIGRALHANYSAGQIVEGGSTITQQLIKIGIVGGERSLRRKLREALTAVWFDFKLGKDKILALYLNNVYLGSGAYGMAAAARVYFDKRLTELTLADAALLAGLIKAPSEYNPIKNLEGARWRAGLVLDAMVETGAIDAATAERTKVEPTSLKLSEKTKRAETSFADWIAKGQLPKLAGTHYQPVRVRTTMIPELQSLAERAVEDVMAKFGDAMGAKQAALVVMRPNGAVLAMVGGRDYDNSQFNRAVDARRQPGSVFKMFVYLAALRNGHTPSDLIDAGPISINGWEPENFGGGQYGSMALSDAFSRSVNTAAVRLAQDVGLKNVVAAARDLGITSPLIEVPSMALGTNEVSLLDLTTAFAAVRTGRTRLEPWGISAFGVGSRPLRTLGAPSGTGEPLAHQAEVISLLRGVIDHGTGRAAALDGFAAGKTGTSQDYRDAWFVGFNEKLVTGVWVGNDDDSPMQRVTGGSLPARIWKRFITEATPILERKDRGLVDAVAVAAGEAVVAQTAMCDISACSSAYRSFRAPDCTYQPYNGPRKLCTKGERPVVAAISASLLADKSTSESGDLPNPSQRMSLGAVQVRSVRSTRSPAGVWGGLRTSAP